jgi:hypothetical protein
VGWAVTEGTAVSGGGAGVSVAGGGVAAEAEGPPGVGEGEGWFFMASREAPAAASMRIMMIRANIRCRFMVGLATYDEEKSSTTALYHVVRA